MYQPKGAPFIWSNRVYFGDTDAAGVVYHGKYVYWMEAARIEFLDHIGCPYSEFQAEKIGFIPAHVELSFKHPLKFEDKFQIHSAFTELSRVSATITSTFKKEDIIIKYYKGNK